MLLDGYANKTREINTGGIDVGLKAVLEVLMSD